MCKNQVFSPQVFQEKDDKLCQEYLNNPQQIQRTESDQEANNALPLLWQYSGNGCYSSIPHTFIFS